MNDENNQFDVFIAGSDQIWNTDCTCAVVPEYFLSFVADDKKKIAYAPSIAHNTIAPKYRDEFEKYIKQFDYIAVREKTGAEIVSKILKQKIDWVCDPTFLLNEQDWNKLIENKKDNSEEYIFLYCLEKNNEIEAYAENLARKEGMKIKYYSEFYKFNKLYATNIYPMGPIQFLNTIKRAKYIVANSFHATCFSIIFKKKFVSYVTAKSGSRVRDLLNAIGLTERLMHEGFDITEDIDYNRVYAVLDKEIERSKRFLLDSIGE